MSADAVDLFAGPGGRSVACKELGITEVGFEHDAAACQTWAAAGHLTVRCDVSTMDPTRMRGVKGAIGSPPCPAFSTAGKQEGVDHLPALCAAVRAADWSGDPDPKVWLGLEVGRWVEAIQPKWVACEQVPPVMPLWDEYARLFASWGYSTWCGVLNAADYGVPQTRKRAFLLASRTRIVGPPPPTHTQNPTAGLFGPALLPWVSMAEALGWADEDTPARTVCGNRAPRWAYEDADGTRGRVVLNPGRTPSQPNRRHYEVDAPAPAVAFGHDSASWRWELHTNRGQDEHGERQTVTSSTPTRPTRPRSRRRPEGSGHGTARRRPWSRASPPTSSRASPQTWFASPGYRSAGDGPRQNAEGSIKITIADALTLQSFDPAYPLARFQDEAV